MTIRPYNKETDEKEVVELWLACKLVTSWNNPNQDIERKLKVDPDLFLVGTEKGRVIATVMGGYEGHRGWVNYLAVHPDFQRKGYATELMSIIEEKLKARGAPKINLQVRSSNTDVISFYKSLNYKVDDVLSLGKRLEEDRKLHVEES